MVGFAAFAWGEPRPEALLVVVGDQHSAYERLPQFVAAVDQLREEHPEVPVGVIINGDAFEYGNVVARRSGGAIDFATFAALVRRGPTILNLGNHEPDLFGMADLVHRLREIGVIVVSGNLRNRGTGEPYAPASAKVRLGAHELTLVGVTTDALATFRVAVRPDLDLTNPVTWARQNLPRLFANTGIPILVSHAGLRADRELLNATPDNALFLGAHDHLQFVHQDGDHVYVHSGSWLAAVSVAALERNGGRFRWNVHQRPIEARHTGDAEIGALVRETLEKHLTTAEMAVVGRSPRALSPREAALLAVETVRRATGADAVAIGATTFGGGIPAGPLTRYVFDSWIRFDGGFSVGELTGEQLQQLATRCNQGPDTPFDDRTGENLVFAGPETIDPRQRYRLVTSDWIARRPEHYLGAAAVPLQPLPEIKLKAAVLSALADQSHRTQ